MTLYAGPVFEMARTQFHIIADHLEHSPRRARAAAAAQACDRGVLPHPHGRWAHRRIPRVPCSASFDLGPAKGGTRFAPGVDLGEVAALAIWMSWKCALAELPYGGGKGGVAVDPASLSLRELENLSRRYMQEMIPFVGPRVDVMAPDMGTNEQVMAWFMDTYSMYQGVTVPEIVTGKPVGSGGTLGRREATGHGVAFLAFRALDRLGIAPSSATAIVQGFGNVGSHAALGLAARGVRVTGISDHTIALHDHRGFDVKAAVAHVARHGVLKGFADAAAVGPREALTLPCDVLAPCAVERVIDAEIAERLQCRIIAEGANGPTTPEADAILAQRTRNLRRARHSLQRRRRHRQLFRMGAGPAAIFLVARRGDGPARTGAGALLGQGDRKGGEGRHFRPYGGDGDRSGAGAGGEAVERVVPVSVRAASGQLMLQRHDAPLMVGKARHRQVCLVNLGDGVEFEPSEVFLDIGDLGVDLGELGVDLVETRSETALHIFKAGVCLGAHDAQ